MNGRFFVDYEEDNVKDSINEDKFIFSVKEINGELKKYLEGIELFKKIYIRGELSNVKYSGSHIYFSLKESVEGAFGKIEEFSLRCSAFNYKYKGIATNLQDGKTVVVYGKVNFYEKAGTLQIVVESLKVEDSIGDILAAKQKLYEEYSEKGYFNIDIKKPLPKLPRVIGVVTSETGAVFTDIISTRNQRNPNTDIYLYPSKVQGDGAAVDIAYGIDLFNKLYEKGEIKVDVIIVGRGGGSVEDLNAYNERPVIEAIYSSKIPVVSAVGHEPDYSLSDSVADVRAATPTQAALMVIPDIKSLEEELKNKENNIKNYIKLILENKLSKLEYMTVKLEKHSPKSILENNKIKLINFKMFLDKTMTHKLELKRSRCIYGFNKIASIDMDKFIHIKRSILKEKSNRVQELYINLLSNLKNNLENKKLSVEKYSVEDILKQGYSIVRKNDKIINSANDLKSLDELEIQFYDSKVTTVVK